jgi:hypothetical protein
MRFWFKFAAVPFSTKKELAFWVLTPFSILTVMSAALFITQTDTMPKFKVALEDVTTGEGMLGEERMPFASHHAHAP